jgi:DNA-binding transcriptional MocR family regulator
LSPDLKPALKPDTEPPPSAAERASARAQQIMRQSTLREVLGMASRPGVLSFAVGLPGTALFPVEGLARAAAQLLADDRLSLQYGIPYGPLKAQIVELMRMRGVTCRPEQVFLTSGSQQAMDILARLLLVPGGRVMLERTVYDGMQMAIKRLEPEILSVPTDLDTGIDADAVEAHLEAGPAPAFLYLITDGHNPLGVSLPEEKRRRLATLARQHRMPILEDDAYGFLYFGESPAPPLRAFEDEWVFYLGSFSKILAPGLRAGWMVVPEPLVGTVAALKHSADLDTPSFSQRMISTYLDSPPHGVPKPARRPSRRPRPPARRGGPLQPAERRHVRLGRVAGEDRHGAARPHRDRDRKRGLQPRHGLCRPRQPPRQPLHAPRLRQQYSREHRSRNRAAGAGDRAGARLSGSGEGDR